MPDDDLRTYLARQSPWLALHDLGQEVQELRALVERMTSSPGGGVLPSTSTRADEQWQNVTRKLESLEQQTERVQMWASLFSVQIAPQRVLLADARRVERVNQDERMAGLLLALCTLFAGAWLQTVITGPVAVAVDLLAASCFGSLAVFFYRRSHRAWQELHEEGLHLLWPPREEAGGGGAVR